MVRVRGGKGRVCGGVKGVGMEDMMKLVRVGGGGGARFQYTKPRAKQKEREREREIEPYDAIPFYGEEKWNKQGGCSQNNLGTFCCERTGVFDSFFPLALGCGF